MQELKLHRMRESTSATFYDGIYGPLERRAARVSRGDVVSAWTALLLAGASFFTMLVAI